MAKTKISTNEVKAIAKFNQHDDTVIKLPMSEDKMVEVTIRHSLPYDEYANFISDVINGMFDSDGEYIPYARQASYHVNLIKYFTNIKVENVKAVYDLINNTNIIELIVDTVSDEIGYEMYEDIIEGVQYRKQKIYHASKWNDLADTLNNALDSFMSDIEKNKDKFADINTNRIVELADKLSKNSDNIAVKAVNDKLDTIEE